MLPSAKLKSNLEFNRSLSGIIDILKIAASIKLRQFQAREPVNEVFLEEIKSSVGMLKGEKITHPFFVRRENLPKCVVGVTSDEGFIGGLNTLVINTVLDSRKDKDIIIVLGERGAGYLEDVNIPFVSFPGISDDMRLEEIKNVGKYLLGEYLKGKFAQITIVYPRFVSISAQHIETIELLPCSLDFFKGEFLSINHGSTQETLLNNSQIAQQKRLSEGKSFSYEQPLIEPDMSQVAEGLVRLWIDFVLSEIFWSSKLSELSARLMHLDSSEQELNQMNQKAKIEYFRYLHSLADKTIREVIASRFLEKVKV